jgi:NitT/TauT family transport system substrate-binding protein
MSVFFVLLLAVPAAAADKVRVAMPTEGFLYTPLYLAIDAGFMKDEGIEADLIQFRGGGAAISGLASGSVEFCSCVPQNAINAAVKGADVKMIGTIIRQYASNVVLREDVAKRLNLTRATPMAQRLAALRGLKIGASGAGSSTDFLIRFMAKKANLSPERDFTVLFLAGGGPILAAFAQKRIDGFVLSSPTSDIAVMRYQGVLLIDMSRGELDDLNGYPSSTLVAKTSWLKGKSDLSERFLRAIVKADRMIRAEPARAKQTLRKRFAGVTDDVYAAAWDANVDAYPADPRVEEMSVARAISFLSAVQGAKIPGAPKDYFDNSYADAAMKTLR